MTDKPEIRAIVARALADAGDELPFSDTDSLVVSGRLASLDVVAILTEIEDKLEVEIHADEFDPMRFDSVDSIAELVTELRAG